VVKNLRILTSEKRELQWRASIALLVIYSGFTNFWGLAHVERSEYYAAVSKSMSKNLGNFFFGAMDPGGIVSVDKIPGSFWIPAIFVKTFGFSTLAVTIPNAIAAVLATLVITFVIKKYYGMTTALIAGWILATTPIVVAVARSNQPFTIYYLAIAIAIRYSIIALNETSRKNLIWAGVWIAIAFHAYMLLAWSLWPPLILAYLATDQSWKSKIRDLLIAGSVSLLSSSLWMFIVALIPDSQRPFVGGTNTNSSFDVAFGYNGFGRFLENHSLGGASSLRTFAPPFGGKASPLRFFNDYLIGQITWLLPTALISIALLIYLKCKTPIFLFASSYLLLQLLLFSAVQGMHQFYASTIVFPIAILIVIGIQQFRERNKPHFTIGILVSAVTLSVLITLDLNSYLAPTPIFQILLLGAFLGLSIRKIKKVPEITTSILFVGVLVLSPALWSIDAIKHSDAWNPMAGPTFADLSIANFKKNPDNLGGLVQLKQEIKVDQEEYAQVIKYIRSNTDSKYALATITGQSAAPFITATDDLILPIGGINGQDPAPTLIEFKSLLKSGEIRFVLAKSEVKNIGVISNQEQIERWILTNCVKDSYSRSSFALLDCKHR